MKTCSMQKRKKAAQLTSIAVAETTQLRTGGDVCERPLKVHIFSNYNNNNNNNCLPIDYIILC